MAKKNFTVKISRTIKEMHVMNVPAENALKARHYAEFKAENEPSGIIWVEDPDSLPGKITTAIVGADSSE